jgi:cation:H+ antiporter
MINFLWLLVLLILIVWISNLFCNALEHLGEKLNISDGVTGSIFAAIGTALPETMIPILALFTTNKNSHNDDIGIGAILGAPFMLSTLSLFIMAIFTFKKRGINGKLQPHFNSIKRDLKFFIFSYTIAFISIFCQHYKFSNILNSLFTFTLGFNYLIYLLITFKESKILAKSGQTTVAKDKLILAQLCRLNPSIIIISTQLLIAIILLLISANFFIVHVNKISNMYHISSFLIALIIIPIATEMPEKINSIIWLKNNKDTLAIGNITGAMVFQGSLLPIVGILFSNNWNLTSILPLFGIITTLLASLWFYLNVKNHNIRLWHFIINGLLYITSITLSIIFSNI